MQTSAVTVKVSDMVGLSLQGLEVARQIFILQIDMWLQFLKLADEKELAKEKAFILDVKQSIADVTVSTVKSDEAATIIKELIEIAKLTRINLLSGTGTGLGFIQDFIQNPNEAQKKDLISIMKIPDGAIDAIKQKLATIRSASVVVHSTPQIPSKKR